MITQEDYDKMVELLTNVLSNHVHGGECDEILAELDQEMQDESLIEYVK